MAVDMSKWPMGYAIKYSAAVKAGNTALVNAMKGGPNSLAYQAYVSMGTTDTKLYTLKTKMDTAKRAYESALAKSDAAYKDFIDAWKTATVTQSSSVTRYGHTTTVGTVVMSTTGTYSGISTGDYVFIYPAAEPFEGYHKLSSVVNNNASFPIPKQAKAKITVNNPRTSTLIVKGSGTGVMNQKYKIWKPLAKKMDAAKTAYGAAIKAYSAYKKTTTANSGTGGKAVVPPTSQMGSSTSPVKKNLPAVVKEMYFPDTPEFNGTIAEVAGVSVGITGKYDPNKGQYVLTSTKTNTPAKAGTTGVLYVPQGNVSQQVKEAAELWNNAKSSKGMIQQWMLPMKQTTSGSATAGNASNNYNKVQPNKSRSAFQFIYNPSTIDMSWGGTPNVDIALIMSGKAKIPFMGAGFTSSTITFQVLVNRMPDMKYLSDIDATPIGFYQQLYNRSDVTVADLKDIRDNGTMYDIEYLLNTIVPYKMKSVLRKRWTSDIGYLHSFPLEVHLGKGMRYLGIISSFNINHKIFNENMVPLMTWVNITVSRIPDVAYEQNEILWDQTAGV